MQSHNLIVLTGLVSTIAAAEDLRPAPGLEQSYYCAICEPVKTGNEYVKQMAEKFPEIEFFVSIQSNKGLNTAAGGRCVLLASPQ